MSRLRVLIIDDEESIRHMLSMLLKKEGYEVRCAQDGQEGLKALLAQPSDLVLCDVRMPVLGGLELLDALKQRALHVTVIVMSAFGDKAMALEAMRRGAYDYIDKPFKNDEVLLAIMKAVERLQLRQENDRLRQAVGQRDAAFEGMVGAGEAMQTLFHTIDRVAPFDSTVLISGESGTGKELVAQALHRRSGRSKGPWVPINCGAIPEHLIESELFGHVKGAFTDASQDKKGLFQQAHTGTIFLDEIAELPLTMQVKLLRVLQEGEVRRLGDSRSVKVDVRVIAASHHVLSEQVKAGLFREDLFYRLNVIHLHLPPLRERTEDLPALIQHFITHQNKRLGTALRGVAPDALALMRQHTWPGNIRELQNCVERGVVLSRGELLQVDALPEAIRERNDALHQLFHSDELSIKKLSAMLERVLIRRALEQTHGNRTNAAKLLEISHRALLYKIKAYGLETVGLE